MSRDAWILVHVVGVVLFLGNVVVTAVWKSVADRTRAPAVVAFAQRLVTITDVAFTAPGLVLILISGLVLADDLGGIGGPGWLTLGFALFVASGVIYLVALVPIQVAQARMARAFRDEEEVPAAYWRLANLWAVVGSIVAILPLVTLYLMTVKP